MGKLPTGIHVVHMREAWDNLSVLSAMLPHLRFDVLLTAHAPTSVAYCLHRALLVTERPEELWCFVPGCDTNVTGGHTLLPLLQQLHSQPIWWLESWMKGRELLIADLAIEQ